MQPVAPATSARRLRSAMTGINPILKYRMLKLSQHNLSVVFPRAIGASIATMNGEE